MGQLSEFFKGLFATDRWTARWHCGYWSDFHGWLYIISDLMIWIAYFLIPLIIMNYFLRKKTYIQFSRVYFLFAAFILLCGTTHFLDALMFWMPLYRLSALVRFITAVLSVFTVYHLARVLPVLFRQRTNIELEREIELRKDAEYKLAEANRGLQAFAYLASHDLQEPLRKINVFTAMLLDANKQNFDSNSLLLADKVVKSSARMQTLVTDVLSLSSLEKEVQLEPVDLNKVIDDAVDSLELRIGQTGAKLNISPLPMVMGNASYLSQLFFNLIGNALKFNNGVPVIDITSQHTGNKIVIRVSDNGIGMNTADTNRIFEPFFRLHGNAQYEGSGIGLVMCKKIVDVHGGTITVESQPGNGTTFSVTLISA